MNTARPVKEIIDDHFIWFNELLEKMKGNTEVFEYLRVKASNLVSRLDREDPNRQQGRQEFHTSVQKWPKFYKRNEGGGIVIRVSETAWTWDLNDDIRIKVDPDWDSTHTECDCTGKPL